MPGIFAQRDGKELPVKFSAPGQACPTSCFTAFLKQVNRTELNLPENMFLAAAFADFFEGVQAPGESSKKLEAMARSAGNNYEYENRVLRRYDGDATLPSGRYSTVCTDAAGNDEGTLVREMLFYMNPQIADGHIEVYDSTVPGHDERIKLFGLATGPGIQRLVFRYYPFAQLQNNNPLGITRSIDLVINEVTIENVLDLRKPAAAQWLCETISSLRIIAADGTEMRCFPNRPDISNFAEMFPSLMDQARGGGNIHKITGLYLRQLGIAGLVFPSSRGDASVTVNGDKIISFHGWSFVDYRDAPLSRQLVFWEERNEWPSGLIIEGGDDNKPSRPAFAAEVSFHADGFGTTGTVMETRGIEQRLQARYIMTSMEAAIHYILPRAEKQKVQELLIVMIRDMRAIDAFNIGSMILFSLLGLQQAQSDLLAFVENQLSDHPVAALLLSCAHPPPASDDQLAKCRALTGIPLHK